MKKIYALFLWVSVFYLQAQTVPTCSLDPAFIATGKEGIWPDSATNFVSGIVGQAYVQNVTIVIPKDTVSSIGTVTYSTVDLQPSSNNWGLPPGLSLTGTPSTFKFPGNAASCMEIYGTPTTAGTYPLTFVLKVYSVNFGSSIPVTTYTVGYYKIVISAVSGIASNVNASFQLMQNNPNPVINSTSLKFTASMEGKAKVSVYNITGQKLIDKEFNAFHGENSYELDATALESGIYLYAIELNGQKQIRRMVVAK